MDGSLLRIECSTVYACEKDLLEKVVSALDKANRALS